MTDRDNLACIHPPTALKCVNLRLRSLPLTDYLTEQEQVEQLKAWIKQYGMTILVGVVLAIVIASSWNYWQRYQNRVLTRASSIYDEMLTSRAQNDTSNTEALAHKLINHYVKTPYASMAALMLSRDAVTKKDYAEAQTQLNWVIKKSSQSTIREIAKIRLARILLAQNKTNDALQTLDKVDDAGFNGLIDEVKGDVYLKMQNTAKAREFYQLALQTLPKEETPRRPILQMKLDNLTTATDPTA